MASYRVALSEDDLDGGWIAECLDIPGVVSQGDTEQAALDGLREAIAEAGLRTALLELESVLSGQGWVP